MDPAPSRTATTPPARRRRLLAAPDRPTAIFATSDVQAIGVLEAAQAAGIPVPEELSVIGLRRRRGGRLHGLTTIAQPLEESGALGAELLLRALAGGDVERRRLPLSIVERATTGPPGLADRG